MSAHRPETTQRKNKRRKRKPPQPPAKSCPAKRREESALRRGKRNPPSASRSQSPASPPDPQRGWRFLYKEPPTCAVAWTIPEQSVITVPMGRIRISGLVGLAGDIR